jgi:hypothetical protein
VSGARLAPEFALLARCCRWNFAKASEDSLPEVPPGLDWNRLVHLARRHRIQGLAWNALAKQAGPLPDEVKEGLSSDARSIAATNLGIAAECRELQGAFDRANLPLLFVKGLTVGALAYRAPLLKMGWDIDLLIDPHDLAAATKLLTERGYSLLLPPSLADLSSWHQRSKESVWHRDGSLHIELHTRLTDNPRLNPTIDVHSPRRRVEVSPAVSLPTLAEDELFAYLAVHGASSAWFRLKWISDFAALLHGRSGDKIGRLYRRSQELGAARAAGQALLLADRLFDVLEPLPALRGELARDRATRLLCRAALRMMTVGSSEPTERPLGTLAIHWTQLLLKPGLDFKISELWRQGSAILNRQPH